MSAIHYKFRSALEYSTLLFDGLSISVEELKLKIFSKEGIRAESFDLIISNPNTKQQYRTNELIPRNYSVIVQRIPRENAARLPKLQNTSTSRIVASNSRSTSLHSADHVPWEGFSIMTEEQRLAHVKEVSYKKYHPQNYKKWTSGSMPKYPPSSYVCNQCLQPGHWYRECPLLASLTRRH